MLPHIPSACPPGPGSSRVSGELGGGIGAGGGEGLRGSQTKTTPSSVVKPARGTPRRDRNESRNEGTQTPTESARAPTGAAAAVTREAEEAEAGDHGQPSVSSGIDRDDSGSLSGGNEGEEVPVRLSSEVTVVI